MNNNTIRACPVCGNKSIENISIVEKVQGIRRIKCKICELIYFEHNHYPKPVYNFKYNMHFRRPGDIRKAGIMAEILANLVNKESRFHRVLEIGAGNGLTAFLLQFMGYNVEVVEMDLETVHFFREKLRLDVWHGRYEDLNIKTEYDLIYAGHIIEHTEDPLRFLNKCRENLKDTGILYIDTPCTNFLGKHGTNWKHLRTRQPFEHCSLFSTKTIKVAAEKTKLKIVKIDLLKKFENMHIILKKEVENGNDQNAQVGNNTCSQTCYTYT